MIAVLGLAVAGLVALPPDIAQGIPFADGLAQQWTEGPGQCFGEIHSIKGIRGGRRVTVELANFFTGKAAQAEAKKDNPTVTEPAPDGYYIRRWHKAIQLTLSPDTQVVLVGYNAAGKLFFKGFSVKELETRLNQRILDPRGKDPQAIFYPAHGPFWLNTVGNHIDRIVEDYLP